MRGEKKKGYSRTQENGLSERQNVKGVVFGVWWRIEGAAQKSMRLSAVGRVGKARRKRGGGWVQFVDLSTKK